MVTLPPEKLGSFYLGARYDLKAKSISDESVNYDARDLTTHAVCVGMTGSGKTGLCIGLLEEAAMDKVPAIIIDPKGDMTNLLLQFEDLSPADFKKWINPDDAARKSMSVDDYAESTAAKWKAGLADWGQGTERIRELKQSVDYTIFTPGSDAGVPVNILGSFAAPGIDFDDDAEMLHERIQGTVAALLGMIGNKADPSRSREGILLSTLFEHYWRQNEDLDLATIIHGIQKPPVKQLGVFDVETFYPSKDRFQLAMDFNTLIASPQFKYWLQGEDLDIDKIYFTADGKPRHSIFYIAHLSDSERMFFVTLLLNTLITWMRRQSGTSSLRSLLYFDEIFGYFPPSAQPPSKKPLLTILKQARAFGLGAVLVTQNPVDIDYKGLSNAGTWFIGKLQTDKDKERVLGGLEGAIAEAGSSSTKDFGKIISSLSSRTFLMHNVHDSEPIIYHTRWVMSYLSGPMTRTQIKTLMRDKKAAGDAPVAQAIASSGAAAVREKTIVANPPSVAPSIQQRFFTIRKTGMMAERELNSSTPLSLVYEPEILATGKVRFYDSKIGLDEITNVSSIVPPPDDFGRTDWETAQKIVNWERTLLARPDFPDGTSVQYEALPESMDTAKELKSIEKSFSDWLYHNQKRSNLEHAKLKLNQEGSESEEAFQMRAQQVAREMRDAELDKLQERYEAKLDKIDDRIRKEEQDIEAAEEEVKDRKTSEWLGVAETIFSVFVKGRSRSLSSATSKSRMRRKAAQKVRANEEDLAKLQQDYKLMERELEGKLEEIRLKWDDIAQGVSRKEITPRRTDVKVDGVFLVWHPYWVSENNQKTSALA